MLRRYALLASAGVAVMSVASFWGGVDRRPTAVLAEFGFAGLLLGAVLLFRKDDRHLRYVVEVLFMMLVARCSIFFLAVALDYARAFSMSVVLPYAGNLMFGLAGIVVARLHARRHEAVKP